MNIKKLNACQAKLAATFVAEGPGCPTWLTKQYHTAPMKIAKTFKRPDGSLGLIMMDVSPGIMDGDTYELDWHISANANVYVTNQSFTKVHPSLIVGSRQTQHIYVESGGRFEFRPEPVMLYADADFTTVTDVRLDQGGSLLLTEIICAGRRLRGERFDFRRFESTFRIYFAEELVYYNRQRLLPKQEPGFDPVSPAGWDNYACQGTLYAFAEDIGLKEVAHLRSILIEDRFPNVRFGISETYKHGLVIIALATHAEHIQQLFEEASTLISLSC
jgi:urease accessory protein